MNFTSMTVSKWRFLF